MTAAEFLKANPKVTSVLSARDISEFIPAGIRQQTFYSAHTIYAHHLDETQKEIAELLSGKMGPNEIRNRMQARLEMLGYEPNKEDKGSLRDLSSDIRTKLIIDIQEQRARGYARWRSQQKDSVLLVWPANEFVRIMSRKVPRDWQSRWNQARAELGESRTSATYAITRDGPFVALKNDPIWMHPTFNRFGAPWPPFDYSSGMGLRQVTASKARLLGVLKDGDKGPTPARDPMRQVESVSCEGMAPGLVNKLVNSFGIRSRFVDQKWIGTFGEAAKPFENRMLICPDASVVDEIVDVAEKTTATASSKFAFVRPDVIGVINNASDVQIKVDAAFSIDADTVRKIKGYASSKAIKNMAEEITEATSYARSGNLVQTTLKSGAKTLWKINAERSSIELVDLIPKG